MNIFISGNPVDGFRYIGPITGEQTIELLEDDYFTDSFGGEWWVANLISIEEWRNP